MPQSTQVSSFVDDAVAWRRSGAESFLLRMIRSSCSGVPHDAGAAYATLAVRTGNLLDAIDAGRLALPTAERDAVLRFASRARALRASGAEEDALRESIASSFSVCHPERSRGAKHDDSSSAPPFDCAGGDRVELTEAFLPEGGRRVPGWQRHFSASALNAYAECARKWFYKYACSAVEDPGSSAAAYGTAFHLALEDFHGDYPRPKAADEKVMRARVRDCITWAFERNRSDFGTRVEFELQVRRAQRTAQRYVDWLLVQETDAPFEVLGREVPADLELEGRAFVGFIDRLDRDERTGGIGVVDYKTGSIAATPAEYCEKVRRFRDFQLPFYYWARTAAGDRVTKLVLIPLRDALLDVRPVVLEVGKTIHLDDLDRSRERMIELSTLLATGGVEHFATTTNPAACTYCAYADACAKKPFPEPQRFGR
ncbi:MAG TPA: PD-(D/E)XK nuclease family protein [Candidatus Cybelea sp.]|nr:PD-(D/E)XK nuclease family protein [Candidatus Cybelea sp.]